MCVGCPAPAPTRSRGRKGEGHARVPCPRRRSARRRQRACLCEHRRSRARASASELHPAAPEVAAGGLVRGHRLAAKPLAVVVALVSPHVVPPNAKQDAGLLVDTPFPHLWMRREVDTRLRTSITPA